MKELITSNSVSIKLLNLQQIVIRAEYTSKLNKELNSLMKINLPKENLKIKMNEKFLCSKNTFDQWNIISLTETVNDIESQINELNKNENILVTNFSEGQAYFEISGDNKSNAVTQTLNKITHFDFREKMFPRLSSAQTLIARIDCAIYNLEDRFLITCNRSFGKYLEERFIDTVKY